MKNSVIIVIYIFIISLIILIVKNKEKIFKDVTGLKEKRIYPYIKIMIMFLIILICISGMEVIYKSIKGIISKYSVYQEYKEDVKMFALCDQKIQEENQFYKNLINQYDVSEKEPYIPENFEYVEGEANNGFVIRDMSGNEFVWVPCSKETLIKKNFSNTALISCNYCYDEYYEDFLKSALENGGFYISRYEIGKENNDPVSQKNKDVWTNVNIAEAKEIVNKMAEKNQSIHCELLNGYAYDTTLEWLLGSEEFEICHVDINNQLISGRNQINGIFDFTDNIFELTQERDYDVVVSRGYFGEDDVKMNSRYTVLEEDTNFDGLTSKLTFRVMLY